MKMKTSVALMWITGIAEGLLAIPLIGGTFVVSSGYTVLGVMFLLHAVTLFFCLREYTPKFGSILGIITSLVSWLPLIGWAMHLLTAVVLLISAALSSARERI